MGKLSGVNANLITKVSGVPVANISKVGPVLASSIGLGGGGSSKTFGDQGSGSPQAACTVGPSFPTITLYYDAGTNALYTDSGFTTPFDGQNKFWYNFSDNQSWQIRAFTGLVLDISQC